MKKASGKLDLAMRRGVGGMDEKAFIALYNMGSIRRMEAGELLRGKENGGAAFHLILKGSLAVGKGDAHTASDADILVEGDWFSQPRSGEPAEHRAPVAARENAVLLAIDETVFKALEVQLQLFIQEKLNEQATRRMHKLREQYERAQSIGGYYADYIESSLHRRAAEYERSEVILGILKNVPRLPIHVTKLINMLLTNKGSVREVTQLAKEDPSLVGEILKTINSSYYNLQGKVSDLHHAIAYLGFNQVYRIVVANGLSKTTGRSREAQRLHQHAVLISHLVADICQLHDRRKGPLFMTTALLHDIGKSVVWLLRERNPRWSFFTNMLDQSRMGAMLLHRWNIPDLICRVVEYQTYPEFSPPGGVPSEYRENVAALYLAHAALEYMQGRLDEASKHPFLDDYVKVLNLPGTSLREIVDRHLLAALKKRLNTLPGSISNEMVQKI